MGSRGGIGRSTPPNGLKSSCIAVPRFRVGTSSSSRAARRMSRASCSMDRPCSAARIRNRRFRLSSRLRTVMLATAASNHLGGVYDCNALTAIIIDYRSCRGNLTGLIRFLPAQLPASRPRVKRGVSPVPSSAGRAGGRPAPRRCGGRAWCAARREPGQGLPRPPAR